MADKDWVIETGGLALEFGVSKRTIDKMINRQKVDLHPYLTTTYRRAFLRSHLTTIVEIIYFSDNGLRPSTLAQIFNRVFPMPESGKLSKKDFRKVLGRWVLR